MTRMKTIALIDTRLEVPGVSLGILVSTHLDVMAAFTGNDAFQKAESSGRHIRTKIVTAKRGVKEQKRGMPRVRKAESW